MLMVSGLSADQGVEGVVHESQEATEINGGKPVGGKPFIPELLDRGQKRTRYLLLKM